jgi:hypothetical protein
VDPDSLNPDADPEPAFKGILIRIQSGSRLLMTKTLYLFIDQKLQFTYVQDTEEAFSPQKKPSSMSKNEIY